MANKIKIGLLGGVTAADGALGAGGLGRMIDLEKYEVVRIPYACGTGFPDPAAVKELAALLPLTGEAAWTREYRRLHGWMELHGLPVVGPDLRGAVLGGDRSLVKRLLAREGLPQGLFRSFARTQWDRNASFYRMEIEVTLGYPCAVAEAGDGAAYSGVVSVRSREELDQALAGAFAKGDRVVAEERITGRRLAVALMAGAGGEQSCIGEQRRLAPVSAGDSAHGTAASLEWETYAAAQAVLNEDTAKTIRLLARQAAEALDARGPLLLMFVEAADTGRMLLDAVELAPRLGPDSAYARLWTLSGVAYPSIIDRLIGQAAARQR